MNRTNPIPFSAAIFDLDGTLLDSLGVWHEVDRAFFEARGLPLPEDYARAMQGRSFRECAEYTVQRFQLPETAEAVLREWTQGTQEAYARRVGLIPYARDYLRMLRRAGVKLAVATANRREVFLPCLERCGVLELFDAICTTDDIGDRNKSDGALFRLAAERVGVPCHRCAVFEDVLEGIQGARAAGMLAYAVRSAACQSCLCEIDALADGVIDDFRGMRRYHEWPENARRCVIFTARCEGEPRSAYVPKPGDFVLCADGGWKLARAAGARPDLVIGDFDSSQAPSGAEILRYPVEKDDTDTMLCLKRGLAMGLEDFLIVGGFGGRLDHTLANLQTLGYAARRGARIEMTDGLSWAAAIDGGSLRVPRRPGKLSVFALDSECAGVTIRGAKYEVENAALTSAFPLGMGNDFAGDCAEISGERGLLLVMVCPE